MNKRIQLANQALRLLPSKSNPRVKRWQAPDEAAPAPRRPRGKASADFGEPTSLQFLSLNPNIHPLHFVEAQTIGGMVDRRGRKHHITMLPFGVDPASYEADLNVIGGLYNALGQPFPVFRLSSVDEMNSTMDKLGIYNPDKNSPFVAVRREGDEEISSRTYPEPPTDHPLLQQAEKFKILATTFDIENDMGDLYPRANIHDIHNWEHEAKGIDVPPFEYSPDHYNQGFLINLLGATSGHITERGNMARIGDTYTFVPHADPGYHYRQADESAQRTGAIEVMAAAMPSPLLFAMTGSANLPPSVAESVMWGDGEWLIDQAVSQVLPQSDARRKLALERAYKKGGRELLEHEFPTFAPREWLAQQIVDGEFDRLVESATQRQRDLSDEAVGGLANIWKGTKAELARRLPQFY